MSKPKLGIGLTVAGLILLSYWGAHAYFRYRSLTVEALQQAEVQSGGSEPVHITISGKVDVSVAEAQLLANRWNVWPDKATYLPTSARLGEPGNIIVYGHNLNKIFGVLRKVNVGDEVEMIGSDGQTHRYLVEDYQVVNPSQTELLLPTSYEVLTLYTCTGFLDSQRFVVRARPI